MQAEHEEKLASGKKPRPQSSYSRALDKLRVTTILKNISDSIHAPLNLCQSTSKDKAETVCFISESPDTDDLRCNADAKLLEDQLEYSEISVTRRTSETPARLNHMFKHITPLENTNSVQAFIDARDAAKPSKKSR